MTTTQVMSQFIVVAHSQVGRWRATALPVCASAVPCHLRLAWFQPAGYGHSLLVRRLSGAALSSMLLGPALQLR